MNIADLFVRVRGDTGDVTAKLKGVEGSLASLRRGMDGAHVSTNKLQRVFGTLTTQLTGTNPAVARLSEVLGELTVGGPIVLGITAAAAVIAGAYALITKGAREAKKEQDALIKSLHQRLELEADLPGEKGSKELEASKKRAADIQDEIDRLQSAMNAPASGMAAQHQAEANRITQAKINDLYIQRQNLLNDIAEQESKNNVERRAAIAAETDHSAKVKELVVGFNDLRDAAAKVNAEMLRANRDWWKGYIERTGEAISITGQLEDKLIALLAKGTPLENLPGFGTAAGKPLELDIPSLVAPTVEGAKQINDVAKENARMLSDTISNTAAQTASIIGNALVSFGSGRGNQIGGALGGALGGGLGTYIGHQLTTAGGAYIGGALGSVVGSVIPVVGTLVGGLLGSAVGGLFGSHKKAVDANTQAIKANTQAHLLFAPAGYKVAAGRYDASNALRQLGDANRGWVSRGGVSPLTTGAL